MDYAGNVARFSEAFYKCSNVESEETINGCSQMDFIVELS